MNKKGFTLSHLKGFTIIEIIVVISIIAILAAIILVNVSVYNIRGKDTAAKGNLNTLAVASTKYYESHGNFNNFLEFEGQFANPDVVNLKKAMEKIGYEGENNLSGKCWPDGNCIRWCVSFKLKEFSDPTYYCVDSSGAKKQGSDKICDGTDNNEKTAGICP